MAGDNLRPLFAPGGARLDKIDLHILRSLHNDGAMENQKLASHIGLSPSACLQRVKRLEEGGAIRRLCAEVDEAIFASWSIFWVNVELTRVARMQRARFETACVKAPEVIEAHELAGAFDYLLKIALPSVSNWPDLMAKIDPDRSCIHRNEILPGVRTAKARAPHPLLEASAAVPE